MNTTDRNKRVKPILEAITALEKEHGAEMVHYAMRRRLQFITEERKRVQEIKRIEKELAVLRDKKDKLSR